MDKRKILNMNRLKLYEEFDWKFNDEESEPKTFTVNILERNYGFVVVDADNKDEALDLAQERYQDGDTNWVHTDMDMDSVQEDKKIK